MAVSSVQAIHWRYRCCLSGFPQLAGCCCQRLSLPHLSQLDQHRQVHACHDFDFAFVQKRGRDIGGRPTEHVGEDQNAVRSRHTLQSLLDHDLRSSDIVVPTQGHCGKVVNLADNRFGCVQQFDREPPVSHNQATNHGYDSSLDGGQRKLQIRRIFVSPDFAFLRSA
jgi:hypothetical protein